MDIFVPVRPSPSKGSLIVIIPTKQNKPDVICQHKHLAKKTLHQCTTNNGRKLNDISAFAVLLLLFVQVYAFHVSRYLCNLGRNEVSRDRPSIRALILHRAESVIVHVDLRLMSYHAHATSTYTRAHVHLHLQLHCPNTTHIHTTQ